MSKRRLIDTNVIVRHLVQDHPGHAQAAGKLFAACDRGEVALVILSAVLAECTFVLESFYKHSRADIARTLAALVSSPGVEIERLVAHLDALERYRRSKLHFLDCLIASSAAADQLSVATFDADFKKFSDVVVDVS
jgi:predicted nucleic acid-binding protein